MAQNQELYENAINVLTEIIKANNLPAFGLNNLEMKVDEIDKVRLHLGKLIFYAYDLRVSVESKEKYAAAVRNTKAMSGKGMFEDFLVEGTIAELNDADKDIIGWYLTKV